MTSTLTHFAQLITALGLTSLAIAMKADTASNKALFDFAVATNSPAWEVVNDDVMGGAARQSGGAALDVFVAVDSPQGPLWLELDSGNAQPVLLAPHTAEQLGLKLTSEPMAAVLRLSAGIDYPCTVASKEMIDDGLLNAAFFQKHIITLDLKNMRAWVRRNAKSTEGNTSRLLAVTAKP